MSDDQPSETPPSAVPAPYPGSPPKPKPKPGGCGCGQKRGTDL